MDSFVVFVCMLILLLLSIVNTDVSFKQENLDRAVSVCKSNNGLKEYAKDLMENHTVVCNNGVKITYDFEEKTND